MVLISAGFIMFLLPFSLVSYSKAGWDSAQVIVLIIMGVVCLVVFLLWEKYLTPVTFFPFELLKDRTVMNAALTHAIMFMTILWVFLIILSVEKRSLTFLVVSGTPTTVRIFKWSTT